MAQAFTFKDEEGFSLQEVARIDTMVTVVDCFNFHKNLNSVETVLETVKKGEEQVQTEIPLS